MAKDPRINHRSPHFNEERLQWFKERYGLTSQTDFEKAASGQEADTDQDGQGTNGSGMVDRDKASPEMKPPRDWRELVDELSFNKEWTNEQIEAVAERYKQQFIYDLKQAMETRAERTADKEQSQEHDQDKDRDDRGDDYGLER